MSTKRQPSKQRRQTQNQRQRAALEARRANAAAGPVPSGKVGGGSSTSEGSGGGGSLFSRLRGTAATGRAARTGVPVGGQPVGYRAALSALLAAVAGVVVGALLLPVPVDASGDPVNTRGAIVGEWALSAHDTLDEDPSTSAEELADAVEDWTPNGTEPYGKAGFPLSLGLLLPVVGAGLAFRAVSKRESAKVVNRAMYVTLFGTLLSQQPIIFLPTVIGIGIAAFQVRKAEVQAAADEPTGADDERAGDGGVIDVDEVDDVDSVDEVEADELVEDDSFLDAEVAAGEAAATDDDTDTDADADADADAAERSVFGRLRRRP